MTDACAIFNIIKLGSLVFGFKVSNLLFGPVTVKAKLMTTSIRDTENIVLPLQLTMRNVATSTSRVYRI